jgi:hypothetical protein
MAGRGRKNTDHTLVLALACGKSVPDASKTGGVSERSVYRRLDDPATLLIFFQDGRSHYDRMIWNSNRIDVWARGGIRRLA